MAKTEAVLDVTTPEQLVKVGTNHPNSTKIKQNIDRSMTGEKREEEPLVASGKKKEDQEERESLSERECVGDKRCGDTILTVCVRRLHNMWASTYQLMKPALPNRQLT